MGEYRRRWLREHPRVCIYLTREEYVHLKKLADKLKWSYKNVLLAPLSLFAELSDCTAKPRVRFLRTLKLEEVVLRCPGGEVVLPRSTYEKLREIIPILPEPS